MGKLGWRKIDGVFYPPEEVERIRAEGLILVTPPRRRTQSAPPPRVANRDGPSSPARAGDGHEDEEEEDDEWRVVGGERETPSPYRVDAEAEGLSLPPYPEVQPAARPVLNETTAPLSIRNQKHQLPECITHDYTDSRWSAF